MTTMTDRGPFTREELIGCPDPASAQEVRVTRAQLYPVPARRGPAWYWLYSYTVDGGPNVEYGQGLVDFRRWARRNFPNARIVETWKSAAAPLPRVEFCSLDGCTTRAVIQVIRPGSDRPVYACPGHESVAKAAAVMVERLFAVALDIGEIR